MFHTPLSTSELLTCSKVIDSIFDKKKTKLTLIFPMDSPVETLAGK